MITILTSPDDISSVNRSVIWELQSNNFQPNAPIKSIISISNGGTGLSNIQITNHGYFGNHVVQITGTTSYNGKYDVIPVDANNFKIIKPFTTTQQSGGAQLISANFQITAEIKSYNETRLNIITAVATTLGGTNGILIETSVVNNYKLNETVLINGSINYDGFHLIRFIESASKFVIEPTGQFTITQTGNVIKETKLGSKIQKGINVSGIDLFRFDVSNFLKAAVSFNLSALNQTIIQSPNDAVITVYQIRFTESWENAAGLMTPAFNELFTTEKRVINSTLQHRDIQNMNAFSVDSSAKRFLTNIPKNQSIKPTEEIQLSFINTTDKIFKFKVSGFDANNNLIASPIFGTKLIIGRHGVLALNSSIMNSFTTAIKIEIGLIDASNIDNSEKITFLMDRLIHCDSIRLWWQNRLSGMDAYTFTGRVEKKQKSKKELFKKLLHKGFASRDRGTGILSTENIITYEINSEFLTAEQMTWLAELISSPEVFMQEGTNFIPIIITDADEVIQNTEELQQFKIKFIEANELISQ